MEKRRKLHKDGLPRKIIFLVIEQGKHGRKFTISELAEELGFSNGAIETALCALRKRGIMINPVGGGWDEDTQSFTEGVLVDTSTNKKFVLEVNERYNKQFNPRIEYNFTLLEKTWIKFPELREKIEENIENLQLKLIEYKKTQRALGMSTNNQ